MGCSSRRGPVLTVSETTRKWSIANLCETGFRSRELCPLSPPHDTFATATTCSDHQNIGNAKHRLRSGRHLPECANRFRRYSPTFLLRRKWRSHGEPSRWATTCRRPSTPTTDTGRCPAPTEVVPLTLSIDTCTCHPDDRNGS